MGENRHSFAYVVAFGLAVIALVFQLPQPATAQSLRGADSQSFIIQSKRAGYPRPFLEQSFGNADSQHADRSQRGEVRRGFQHLSPKSDSGSYRRALLELSFQLKGKPYAWNASGPNAFDCSGFVWYVLRTVLGESRFPLPYNLPNGDRTPQSIYYRNFLANQNASVACEKSEPGDIVFFPASTNQHSHIGLITNPEKSYFITDQAKGVGVREAQFGPRSYWANRPAQCFKNIWIY